MGKCKFCGNSDSLISKVLHVCRECVLTGDWDVIKSHVFSVHEQVRKLEELPRNPPKADEADVKLRCNLCINECSLTTDDISYCGLRNMNKTKNGALPLPSKSIGYIHGYLDRIPTNCCNAWFCNPVFGTYSYAAFLYGCTFNCLFCQNASHKHFSKRMTTNVDRLANEIVKNKKITCICYFGGTPEAQFPFSINLANIILEKIKSDDIKRTMKICWEWNGSGNQEWVEKCMEIAFKTGGNIKFDLKSFNEKLNIALCGISNERTLENFKFLANKYFGKRLNLPEMSACTLLVPGYVNHEEVEQIAKFISSINDKLPYSLLVFHPDYQMRDLPITPKEQVNSCLKVAKDYLEHVHLGNTFLLKFS